MTFITSESLFTRIWPEAVLKLAMATGKTEYFRSDFGQFQHTVNHKTIIQTYQSFSHDVILSIKPSYKPYQSFHMM